MQCTTILQQICFPETITPFLYKEYTKMTVDTPVIFFLYTTWRLPGEYPSQLRWNSQRWRPGQTSCLASWQKRLALKSLNESFSKMI